MEHTQTGGRYRLWIAAAGAACAAWLLWDVLRELAFQLAAAYLLMALGKRDLGDAIAADEALAKLRVIDPYNSRLCFLTKLGIL